MKRYLLSHLSDDVLLRALTAAVANERTATAEVLAHIAEVDARRLYLPAAYPSMFAYSVGELHLSEDAAYKRIQAARVARRFPVVLDALAGGRLHLAAVCLLAPYLTEDTADGLLTAATRKSKAEIEQLLAARFPRPDVPVLVRAIPSPGPVSGQLAPGQVEASAAMAPAGNEKPHAPEPVDLGPGQVAAQLAPGQVGALDVAPPVADRALVKPLAPQRYAVQFTMSQSAHDKLRYAQELLGHQVATGDIAQLFERALDALIPQLEQQKFSATSAPRRGHRRGSDDPRYIPRDVRRAVWERDGGQCTFMSESGHRCEARKFVEFDHIQEVARGGEATVAGLRLRCRAHNQYTAERTFGAEFMRHKRIAAAEARAAAKALEAAARGVGLKATGRVSWEPARSAPAARSGS